MTPRVSIGLPVYNGQRFLAEALDSLLAQTFEDFELVISDNASTDSTPELCLRYAARDARIRYHRADRNRGAAWNYNRVFALARGEYFKWAAADDLCAPAFLAACASALDARPDAAACYTRTRIIDASGRVVADYGHRVDLALPRADRRIIQLLCSLRECNAVFGLIRSRVLRRTRLIGDYIGSDGCLLADLCLHGPLVELPEFLFFRRDHAAASSRDKSVAGQQRFFNPRSVGRVAMPDCRKRAEYFRSILRGPIPMSQKLRAMAFLARHTLQSRQGVASELTQAVRGMAGI